MGWFGLSKRTKGTKGTRGTKWSSRKPTLGESRAAERTAKAETALQETEQKIHQLADQARDDLKGSV